MMRRFMDIVENAKPYLFHTTSYSALVEILRQHCLVPKDGVSFVSLSERPLDRGNMTAKQATIAFNALPLREQVIPVVYTEEWGVAHPARADYIAEKGWAAYFGPLKTDDAYRRARAKAVTWKAAEMEHIGRDAGASVIFSPQDVVAVQLHEPIEGLRETLDALGYQHVKIGANLMERVLSEIELSVSREEFIEEYARYFERSTLVGNLGGMTLRLAGDNERMHLGLFDQGALIAYLCVLMRDHGWQIGRTFVHPNYRNTGRMRFLLNWFVTNKGPLLSDDTQTPEAKAMWTALIKIPGQLKLFCVDPDDGSKTPLVVNNDIVHPDPWEKANTLILAEDKNNYYTSPKMRESQEEHRRKSGRKIEWYIPGTDDYLNP